MRTFVGCVLLLAFIGACVLFSRMVVRSFAYVFGSPHPENWECAYMSEEVDLLNYHYTEDCEFLKREGAQVAIVSVEEAEENFELEPCAYCLKKAKRHAYDGLTGIVFIPVLVVFERLMNRFSRFWRRYRLQNPIVRRDENR